MLTALGTAQSDLGTITLVTLIVFSAKPVPSHQALISGAEALGGGLLQTLGDQFRRRNLLVIVSDLFTDLGAFYDGLNRLTQATVGDGRTVTYTWDLAGNLISITVTGQ